MLLTLEKGRKVRFLVVEDNVELLTLLVKGLKINDVEVLTAIDGEVALEIATETNFDLIVMDVMIPKIDGLEVARRLRSEGIYSPILFLTARDSTSDRVAGLEIGGDDYLVKPFEFIELNARIRALLRRTKIQLNDSVTYDDLTMQLSTQRAYLRGKPISFSPREFFLLSFLVRHLDQIFSRQQLLDEIWEGAEYIDENVVDQYISYIRRKIDVERNDSYIETIRGIGYRFKNEHRK